MEVYDNMNCASLKEELKKRKLPIYGNKDELLHRLQQHTGSEKEHSELNEKEDEHDNGNSSPSLSNDDNSVGGKNNNNGATIDDKNGVRTRLRNQF